MVIRRASRSKGHKCIFNNRLTNTVDGSGRNENNDIGVASVYHSTNFCSFSKKQITLLVQENR